MSDTILRNAYTLHQAGKLVEAARLYGEILRADPRHFDALYLLGLAHLQREQFAEAERLMAEALKINPRSKAVLKSRGLALQKLNRHADALASYDLVLGLEPNLAEVHGARGAALSSLKRHTEALIAYDRALALQPGQAAVWSNRGNAMLELGRYAEAVESYDRAVAIKRDYAESWRYRGLALSLMARPEDALASFDKALAILPDDAEALQERGNLLMQLRRHAEAADSYTRALALSPPNASLYYNRANALSILKRYEEAIADCEKALDLDPDYPYARGVLIDAKLQCCDWRALAQEKTRIAAALKSGRRTVSPFNHKAISDSPEEQLQCARAWVANERPVGLAPLATGTRYRHDRIRLTYVSADFNVSAVATLMAGVFEAHDRSRFETIAVSFGTDARTPMRTRLKKAFERFLDVRMKTDEEIAALIRNLEVDIAVDLMGYTGECRSWILARRPAPIQVNYLGFAGTMGADHIDYILADPMVIPKESAVHYAEEIAYLPGCYLPFDKARAIPARTPTRAEAGLPETGFVFASFNNAYKFSPEMFDVWMRLLRAVQGSVLWLPKSHPTTIRNLSREAQARGVAAPRLLFAPLIAAPEEHLARLRLADLFLDTHPYNAHSTAADALWAGLPVLTCIAKSFQGRVAASLLTAIGLPELIVGTAEAYEGLALKLARDADALATLREKLAANRESLPLFDTARFTRHLEAAFATMRERHERGEPPAGFTVESAS